MFVCGFWVVMIALNQYFDGRNKARMIAGICGWKLP